MASEELLFTCKHCGQQYLDSKNSNNACSAHHPGSVSFHSTRADTVDPENWEYSYYTCCGARQDSNPPGCVGKRHEPNSDLQPLPQEPIILCKHCNKTYKESTNSDNACASYHTGSLSFHSTRADTVDPENWEYYYYTCCGAKQDSSQGCVGGKRHEPSNKQPSN